MLLSNLYIACYVDHSSEPSFHSWISPINKISKNLITITVKVLGFINK